MARLGGVVTPRVCEWTDSLPGDPRPSEKNLALLGQNWAMAHPLTVERLLHLIGRELHLERDLWAWQRQFLRELIGSFFSDTDDPAWVTVHACRRGFSERVKDASAHKPHHRGSLHAGDPVLLGRKRIEGLSLLETALPTRRFLAYHPLGVPQDKLSMRRIFVHRWMRPVIGGPALKSTEERLVVIHDAEDLAIARNGLTPVLERYRSIADVHRSPLINLSRLTASGQIVFLAFSCAPMRGEIADLRSGIYTPEYYFRSSGTIDSVLECLITHGHYETF